MPNIMQSLDESVQATLKHPAITVNKTDAQAYTHEIIKDIFKLHVSPDIKPEVKRALQLVPQEDTGGRLNIISECNLKALLAHTKRVLAKAIAQHGESSIALVMEAARKACRPDNIVLTHQPFWEDSAYSSTDSLEDIRKVNKLQAPHYFLEYDNDPSRTRIYCQVIDKEDPVDRGALCFRIEQLPKDLIQRSTVCVVTMPSDDDDINHIIVGGNHFQTAWMLSTILTSCAMEKSLAASLQEAAAGKPEILEKHVREKAFQFLGDFMVPRELKLAGHYLVQDGVKEEIQPSRPARKDKHEKRDLTNPANLKNRGRTRETPE